MKRSKRIGSKGRHLPVARAQLTAVTLAGLALAQTAFACPTCGNSIEHSGGNLGQGFFFSILFMMSMPFVVLGGLALLCWLEIRKARRAATLVATTESAGSAANATP